MLALSHFSNNISRRRRAHRNSEIRVVARRLSVKRAKRQAAFGMRGGEGSGVIVGLPQTAVSR